MARDSGGTHSLPAGNPVVTGNAISSTVHNNTMSDISTALTESPSLSRDYTITGDWDFQGSSTVTGAWILQNVLTVQSLRETVVTVSSSSNTTTIDFNAGTYFKTTLTENTTLAFTNLQASTKQGITIEITQAAGSYTVTYPAGTKATNAIAPVMTSTDGKIDIVTVWPIDATNVFVTSGGQNFGTIA